MPIRRYPRIAVRIPVQLDPLGGNHTFSGEIKQLSLGGCLIEVRDLIPRGKVVWLSFNLGEFYMKTAAKAEYHNEKEGLTFVGASFAEFTPLNFKKLKQFINAHLSLHGSIFENPVVLPNDVKNFAASF
ncbi:MAG: hypothetical protein C0609_11515 [Deltaproteobacteria bacterium]|nr:MAG: hypothetical protein C0609_11515 [Deltaproteobacteria bacterium]